MHLFFAHEIGHNLSLDHYSSTPGYWDMDNPFHELGTMELASHQRSEYLLSMRLSTATMRLSTATAVDSTVLDAVAR